MMHFKNMWNGEENSCRYYRNIVVFAAITTAFILFRMLNQCQFKNIFKGIHEKDIKIYEHWKDSLQYRWKNTTGLVFQQASNYISAVLYPLPKFVEVADEIVDSFVFVTAASDNHFNEARVSLWSIRKHCGPNRLVIFYDLGLNEKHKQEEVLREHPALFWIDSSVRIKHCDFTQLHKHVIQNGGISLVASRNRTGSVFPHYRGSAAAFTHPHMYNYIPTNRTKQGRIMIFSSTMFLVNTQYNFENVIWWYILCALEKMCIAPTKQRFCGQKQVKCHRFDMSMINLLWSNVKDFDPERYGIVDAKSWLNIKRGDTRLSTSQLSLLRC